MAWNEPGGEKRNPWNRPQQSQNDLDDVLRNFQRRLSALFGRGSGGSSLGSGQNSPGFGKGVTSILVLIGAVWIGSGLYRVDAQERAVILRFGQYVQTTGPGYNWHLPWPIETKRIVNVSQQFSVTDDARMLTSDTNLVEVKSAVQYTKPDPRKYLFKVNNVEETLVQVSESAMREAVGQASLDKALAFDPSITDRAKVLLQRTLDNYDMGVNIISVKLGDVIVPDPVQDAQRDAIKADKDRQRYQQDAETYRNDVVPRARGQAAKNLLDAEAYRLQVLALAQGETSRFDQVLSQYEHAPAVTRERMYLETMENVYKNSRKVLVDTKGSNSMLYLPLEKLISSGPQSISNPNDTMTVAPARLPEIQVTPMEDPARARGVR
ncbi:MAG: modulator of FtsH protease HflK [Gammaproteobacteria bacterium]|jgi:membrane protease subunit HflK|nr:rane protease subunit HflK [Gammaproteobacteria bacterium]MEA3138411.1 modulator of FtsH protease HflK [Gammaproteobacteria bacterium]